MDKKTFSPRRLRTFALRRLKTFSPRKFRTLARLASLTSKRGSYCLNVLIIFGVVAFAGASVVTDPLPDALRTSTTIPSIVEALPIGSTKDNVLASKNEGGLVSGAGGVLVSGAGGASASSSEVGDVSASAAEDALRAKAGGALASGDVLPSTAEYALPSSAGDALRAASGAGGVPVTATTGGVPATAGTGGVPATNDQQTLEALSVAVECCDITYDREEWNKSWTNRVNSYLGWRLAECRYAFYDNNGSCAGANHRDHLVAVAEAHRSGGHEWEVSRKEAFYLDTDNLYVLSGSVNTLKSDKDPAEWTPAVGTCRYAREWIAVKTEWNLSVDTAEKQALRRMLNTCPAPPPP